MLLYVADRNQSLKLKSTPHQVQQLKCNCIDGNAIKETIHYHFSLSHCYCCSSLGWIVNRHLLPLPGKPGELHFVWTKHGNEWKMRCKRIRMDGWQIVRSMHKQMSLTIFYAATFLCQVFTATLKSHSLIGQREVLLVLIIITQPHLINIRIRPPPSPRIYDAP